VACNANLRPFDIAGVAAAPIVHANVDKLVDYKIDNDNGIIAIGDIPQQPPCVPLVVNDTDNVNAVGSDDNDEGDNGYDDDDDDNNSLDEDNKSKPAAATDADGNESDSNQGVQ